MDETKENLLENFEYGWFYDVKKMWLKKGCKSFLSKEKEYVDTSKTWSFKMLSNFVMLLLEKL